jgi:hypothetical protein
MASMDCYVVKAIAGDDIMHGHRLTCTSFSLPQTAKLAIKIIHLSRLKVTTCP